MFWLLEIYKKSLEINNNAWDKIENGYVDRYLDTDINRMRKDQRAGCKKRMQIGL